MSSDSKPSITGKKFADLLDEANDTNPRTAAIKLQYGNDTLQAWLLSHSQLGPQVIISSSPNSQIASRGALAIRDWAIDRQKFLLWKQLSLPAFFSGLMMALVALALFPTGLFVEVSDRSLILHNIDGLLSNGLDVSEVPIAVESLLRLSTAEYTSVKQFAPQTWFVVLSFVAIGLLCFGAFTPRSIIGLGKNQRGLKRTRFLTGRLWIWGSIWFVGVGSSILASIIYELIVL